MQNIVRKQHGSQKYLKKIINNINDQKDALKVLGHTDDKDIDSYRKNIEQELRSLRRDARRIFNQFFNFRDEYCNILAEFKDKHNDLLMNMRRAEDTRLLRSIHKEQWIQDYVMTLYTIEYIADNNLKIKLPSIENVIINKAPILNYRNYSFFYIVNGVGDLSVKRGYGVWLSNELYATINNEIASYEINHIVHLKPNIYDIAK